MATSNRFLLIMLLTSLVILVYGDDIESDKQALIAFKKSIGDPFNRLVDWEVNPDPCTWNNVQCKNNRVDTLLLSRNNLTGNLAPELGSLSALTYLSLADNAIGGTIPAELGNLQSIETLMLSYNMLSGEIPASLGNLKTVKLLYVDHNKLTGEVAPEIGSLDATLTLADFSGNNLCWGFWPTMKYVGNYTLCQKK